MTTLPQPSDLPESLRECDQWVCWREQSRGDDGKPTKVPINPATGRYASATDSETWTSFEEAHSYAENGSVDGLGFVFSDADPFVGVDLDSARDRETGDPHDWAQSIIKALDSYTEVSPSRTGYHVIIEGDLPPGRNRRGNVECYETARFFTVTGEHVEDHPETINDRREALFEVYQTHVADGDSTLQENDEPATTEYDETRTLEDDDLLSRARDAENGKKFAQLYDGNTQGYDSHSEADMALACLLAFWTGGDTAQMDRLFRRSGLIREKWDDVHYADGRTYGEVTLSRATRVTTDHYEPQSTGDTGETGVDNEQAFSESSSVEVHASIRTETAVHERERSRIETITRLEKRLRELEAENDRLRAARDELEAAYRSVDEQKGDAARTARSGLLSRLKQLFS